MKEQKISMVIPTRNRKESLFRLLASVELQKVLPFEILIVDSSDDPLQQEEIQANYPRLTIALFFSKPSVCQQRNLGINNARGEYIFLCDDDNELDEKYVELVYQTLIGNTQIQIASGIAFTKDDKEQWVENYPTGSNFSLAWRKFFQLGVWEDVNARPQLKTSVKAYYQKRGNDITKAGWPINTQWDSEVMICTVYGMGASIAKKSYWQSHPYDEALEAHGLGDNYGVVMNDIGSIGVVKAVRHLHHQSPLNRQKRNTSYQQRVYALHYFLKTGKRFGPVNRRYLLGSLVGNFLSALLGGDFSIAGTNLKLITQLSLGRNPYLKK